MSRVSHVTMQNRAGPQHPKFFVTQMLDVCVFSVANLLVTNNVCPSLQSHSLHSNCNGLGLFVSKVLDNKFESKI